MGTFGTDGRGDARANVARGANVTGKLGVDFAELSDFVQGGLINFFLGVETGAHGPFVEKMKERTRFDEANRFGVGEEIESDFEGNAAIEELILGGPGF